MFDMREYMYTHMYCMYTHMQKTKSRDPPVKLLMISMIFDKFVPLLSSW